MDDRQLLDMFREDALRTENELPLYFQLITLIKNLILSGQLKLGDMLPSEMHLCDIYGISRTTVRQALDKLAEENLIIRRRGKGSYIANPKLSRNLNHLYSFTDDMRMMGLNPYSMVMQNTIVQATLDISRLLGIPESSDIFHLIRLRHANSEPLLLEETYIPLYLCPRISEVDFTTSSLYSVLQSMYNLKLERAIETYEAVKLDKETAKLLHCPASSPAFRIQRTGYIENGTTFELTRSLTRSDKCIYTVELKTGKGQALFSRKINP